MSRERELLERALKEWDERYGMGEWEIVFEEIRDYLANANSSEAEPVAFWDTLNNILVPAVPLVSKRTCFKIEAVPLYLHPAPRKEFVRLSQEEIQTIYLTRYDTPNLFARAIEDALEEKNK